MDKNKFTSNKGFKLSSTARLCSVLFCLLNIASSLGSSTAKCKIHGSNAKTKIYTLKSDTFKYADPKAAKNISITIKGKTKSGKKWIAFSINQISNFQGKNPADILEEIMIQNPTARESFEMTTKEDIESRISLWNDRLEKGYPHSGLFIYTDDNPKERKLIGFVVTGGSTVRYYGEFAILLLPQYSINNQANNQAINNQDYRSSILDRFFEWGKEVREIGLGNPKNFKTTEINTSATDKKNSDQGLKHQELKKQIRALFCFAKFRPLAGLYSTCDFNDNWLKPHMRAHRYKIIPQIIADFRETANSGNNINSKANAKLGQLKFFSCNFSHNCKNVETKTLTEQEFFKTLSKIVPADRNPYSIYLPDGTLATVIKNKYGLIKFAYDYPLGDPYEFKMQEKIIMPTRIVKPIEAKTESAKTTLRQVTLKQTVLF